MAIFKVEVAITRQVVEYMTIYAEGVDEDYALDGVVDSINAYMDETEKRNSGVVSSEYEILEILPTTNKAIEEEMSS